MERSVKTIILAVLMALLTACGGDSIVRGQPPQVSINSLVRTGSGLDVELRFRNINQEPLVIARYQFTLTLDGNEFPINRSGTQLYIDSSASEVSTFSLSPSTALDARLSAVESGELSSLEHELEGGIFDQEGHELRFMVKGHIYKVPGRTGQFR